MMSLHFSMLFRFVLVEWPPVILTDQTVPVDRNRLIYCFSKMTYLQVSCAITQKSDSGGEYFKLASGVFLDK